MNRPAVFLDRDGVINRSCVVDGKPYAPRLVKDFILLPKVSESVKTLINAGFQVVVVTNQPDIGNGLVERSVIDKMNEVVVKTLGVDGVYMCAHRQDDGCACRKPNPGMLQAAAKDMGLELERSYMVGDRSSDILAGHAAECYTIFIDYGYKEAMEGKPDHTVGDLQEAVDHIIAREKGKN